MLSLCNRSNKIEKKKEITRKNKKIKTKQKWGKIEGGCATRFISAGDVPQRHITQTPTIHLISWKMKPQFQKDNTRNGAGTAAITQLHTHALHLDKFPSFLFLFLFFCLLVCWKYLNFLNLFRNVGNFEFSLLLRCCLRYGLCCCPDGSRLHWLCFLLLLLEQNKTHVSLYTAGTTNPMSI
jgi:hypothetical protein